MKKYLKFMAFAMVAVFSLAFVSCGDDDDEDVFDFGQTQIEINGKKQTIYPTMLWTDVDGMWGGTGELLDQNIAFLDITVIDDLSYDSYFFEWASPYEPKKGDVISNMKNFIMTPDITGQKKDIEYTYSSGSAKIIDTNVSKETITVQLSNLKMVNGNNSYTFNGTISMQFDFSELH